MFSIGTNARASKGKTDSVCLTELQAFVLPQTSKQTGLYHSAEDKLTKCGAFSIFMLVPEKIYFKVGQQQIFQLLICNGMSHKKCVEFCKIAWLIFEERFGHVSLKSDKST